MATGFAPGDVIGSVFALRTDKQDFTDEDFYTLYDKGISRCVLVVSD